jgi:hypothetical protein
MGKFLPLQCDYIIVTKQKPRQACRGDENGVSPGIYEVFYHAISLLAFLIICGMEKGI